LTALKVRAGACGIEDLQFSSFQLVQAPGAVAAADQVCNEIDVVGQLMRASALRHQPSSWPGIVLEPLAMLSGNHQVRRFHIA